MSVVEYAIADGIGQITLNRPERMNAVTTELARHLEHALNELSSNSAVNVFYSWKRWNFCAGGDVAEVEGLRSDGPIVCVRCSTRFGRRVMSLRRPKSPW